MNLNGAFKVNDNWSAHFQSETNRHYNDGHHRNQETGFSPANGSKTWSGHDGNMQRIWAEGYFPNSKSWVSIGRAWRGLGFQNVLFGNESDGIQFGTPIPGTHLTGSGFWMASTGEGNKESIYGVAAWALSVMPSTLTSLMARAALIRVRYTALVIRILRRI